MVSEMTYLPHSAHSSDDQHLFPSHVFTETVQKFRFLRKNVHLIILATSLEKVSFTADLDRHSYCRKLLWKFLYPSARRLFGIGWITTQRSLLSCRSGQTMNWQVSYAPSQTFKVLSVLMMWFSPWVTCASLLQTAATSSLSFSTHLLRVHERRQLCGLCRWCF